MKVICLVSGGLDSATVMGMMLKEGYDVVPITFDYGQLHKKEIESSQQVVWYYQRQYPGAIVGQRIIKLPFLKTLGGSALTDPALTVPLQRTDGEMSKHIPITYVPGRNTILLSIAMAIAEVEKADAVAIGANAIDYSGYRDCRPEYLEVMNDVYRIATTDCRLSEEWLIGFIEGEGCFSNASYTTGQGIVKYPVFSLQQTDKTVLERILKFFGTGTISERTYRGKGYIGKKRSWEIHLSYYDAYLIRHLMEGKFKSPSREQQFNEWVKKFEHKWLNPELAITKLREKDIKLPIRLLAPLVHMTKKQIIQKGTEIGVPYELTWSCYQGGGSPCGVCDSCKLRSKGFAEVGIPDPSM